LDDVSILLAHDLIHGLTKEFSILLRVAVGADIMSNHYTAAVVCFDPCTIVPMVFMIISSRVPQATASGTVCSGLIEDYMTLGFVCVPEAVQKAIATLINTGLEVALSTKLTPLLQKLTVVAAEAPADLPPE
jgi:hypothetical protein